MTIQKPTLPKGTRDFGPEQMMRREFILNEIKKTFISYGFNPMETPAMENLSVLTGKYGDEGDQLIFKILNSGDYLKDLNSQLISEGSKKALPYISEKALRYDLTVPFARYVVMNRHNIDFPFKRFQIQPVWRADRPQKSRYREFYQCDADVVGTSSLLCEAEIVAIIQQVFSHLGIINYTIKLNNRKILEGIATLFNKKEHLTEMTVAIDKLDKIGEEGVVNELVSKGFTNEKANGIVEYFTSFSKEVYSNDKKLLFSEKDFLKNGIDIGIKGIAEVRQILDYLIKMNISDNNLEFDVSLARGLSYYTGAIFEVKAKDVKIGSVCGGGRYDNLTGVFGMPGISGVGISFGVDRIYDVMEELNLFPEKQLTSTKVLIITFDKNGFDFALSVLQKLRKNNIAAELYTEGGKLKKQLDYANKRNIPNVIIIGDEEITSGLLTLKNMLKGEQLRLNVNDIITNLLN